MLLTQANPGLRNTAAARALGSSASQRTRILSAITELVSRDGYAGVTVAQIIGLAGVSRPTFYEQFPDREGCLLMALAPARRRLLGAVSAAVGSVPPGRGAQAALGALAQFAAARPVTARLAMSEPLSAGRRCLETHDEMIAELAQLIEGSNQAVPRNVLSPDLPSRALIGCSIRMLAQRLGAREQVTADFVIELDSWLASYRRPLAEHRRRMRALGSPVERSTACPSPPLLRPPPDLPADEGGRSRRRATEQQRLRIVFATAEVVSRQGFQPASVAGISRQAKLDTHAFYRLFADKGAAFQACGEMLFRHLMAESALAYARAEVWPERVTEAIAAGLNYLQAHSTLARVALVDSQTAGLDAARRVHEGARAFAIFLEEGSRYEEGIRRPSGLGLEAISTMALELCYECLLSRDGDLHTLAPQIAFVALAPFLGVERASA